MKEPDAVNRRTLHGIAVLDELGTAERVSLERECIWRRYREGERLFERGSSSNEVFFIVEGSVRIVSSSATGRDVSFARAGAGEVIGEMAAIDGLPRSASVSAAEELAGGRVTRHAVCGPRQTEWRNCGQASASAVRHGAPHRGARRRIVESRCHEQSLRSASAAGEAGYRESRPLDCQPIAATSRTRSKRRHHA